MDPDILLVIGVSLAVLAIPSILSAVTDGRAPRVASFVLVSAGVLILFAVRERPGGYTFEDVPHAFIRVVAQVIN